MSITILILGYFLTGFVINWFATRFFTLFSNQDWSEDLAIVLFWPYFLLVMTACQIHNYVERRR